MTKYGVYELTPEGNPPVVDVADKERKEMIVVGWIINQITQKFAIIVLLPIVEETGNKAPELKKEEPASNPEKKDAPDGK